MMLTKAELQVMQCLWSLPRSSGFIGDVLAQYEEPRPAYTTVATILRILTRKGIVKASRTGNQLYYTPRLSRHDYCREVLAQACHDFFSDDFAHLARFVQDEFL